MAAAGGLERALDGDNLELMDLIAYVLDSGGATDEALQTFKASIARNNEPRRTTWTIYAARRACDWDFVARLDPQARRIAEVGGPVDESAPWRLLFLARRKRSAAVGGGAAERSVQPTRCRAGSVFSRTATREHIRIGYFSGDFYSHPVPHLMAGVIERHDRAGFEVIGYDFSPPADDDYRRGFERAFCRMVPIREMSNHAAVKLIARDEIDIAIGLVGWTKRTRPAALTARPAPVQLQWLGYPGTLGAPWIDYIVWPTAGSFDVKTSTTFPRKSSGTSGPVFDTGLFTRGLERAFHGDLGTPSRRATARPYYPPLIGRWCTP